MADFETFCNCDFETKRAYCVCMNKLPLLVVQRACESCRRGRHKMTEKVVVR